jgi:cbb3-type cytochrome oxidase subunit 3
MKRFAFAAIVLFAIGAVFAFAQDKRANAAPARAAPMQLPGNAKPLVSGEFLSGTLWEKPVIHTQGTNTGYSPASGSRVDMYDSFIVVTDAEGISELSLHGSYTKLRFKPYRP